MKPMLLGLAFILSVTASVDAAIGTVSRILVIIGYVSMCDVS
jgi:hypothetical protein